MIIIRSHDNGGIASKSVIVGSVCRALTLASVLLLVGCMQTTTGNIPPPVGAGDPLVLNSGPLTTEGVPAANAEPGSAAVAAGSPPASAPEPLPATPAPAATGPLAVATDTAPASAAVGPAPTKNGYPNINALPAEPGGSVLPPEERKRIIDELEALREGQGAAPSPGGGTAALSSDVEKHGERALQQIEKCSEKGAEETYPECAPTN